MIKKLLNSKSQNYFCTLAIGKSYEKNFKKYTLNFFKEYCKKNDIGLIIITNDLVGKDSEYWKKPEWQKLLAPKLILNKFKKIKNICMIDTDIIINASSPNIFKFHKKKQLVWFQLEITCPTAGTRQLGKLHFLEKNIIQNHFRLIQL